MPPASKYTPKLAAAICTLIASGLSLRKIESQEGMPTKTTILRWLFDESEFRDAFRDQYALAKKIQTEGHADEIIEIADDDSEDEITSEDEEGNQTARRMNREFVQRSKLRIETRQWVAMRLLPKVYGAKSPEDAEDEIAPQPVKVEIMVQDGRLPDNPAKA